MTSKRHIHTERACPARRTKRLPLGVHVAPFLSNAGRPVLLSLGRAGRLFMMAEVTAVAGARGGWEYAPSTQTTAELADATPDEDRLLPRGVHDAPWQADCVHPAARLSLAPVLIAVDDRHRLVAEMAVTPATTPAAVRRDLETILEVHEAAVAAAGVAPDGAVELTCAVNPYRVRHWGQWPRGVYVRPGNCGRWELFAADSTGQIVAEFRGVQHRPAFVRALQTALDAIDPPPHPADDDDEGEEWKRRAIR